MRSLRFRLTLWFSLAVTLTAGTAAAIGFFVVRKQMHDGIDFLLAAEIEEIVQRMGDKPTAVPSPKLAGLLEGHTEIDAPLFFFQVERPGEGVIFRSRNLGDLSLPELSTSEAAVQTITLRDEPLRVRVLTHDTFRIAIATGLEQVEALIDRYQHLLVVGLPLLFAASIAVGFVLSNLALAPVRAMQQSAQRISATNLSERLPVPAGHDEIAALARLLNELFGRLEAAFEQIKRFTADASHELKTPLSLIRLHAERLALSESLSEADRTQVVSQFDEINRLNKLVESLLLLARADAGSLPLDLRRQDTRHFIEDFAEDAAALAEDRGLRFAIESNESCAIVFDAMMMRQVLLNILSNAIRHSPASGRITLSAHGVPHAWTVAIADEGPGVAPEELEHIFGRFVRGPDADHHAPGGSGLGLSIARSIIEAHRGTITATNVTPHGLRVTVALPAPARKAHTGATGELARHG